MYNIHTTHPVKSNGQISSIYECKHVGFTSCWRGILRTTGLIKNLYATHIAKISMRVITQWVYSCAVLIN